LLCDETKYAAYLAWNSSSALTVGGSA
jgi:hypothetical protein